MALGRIKNKIRELTFRGMLRFLNADHWSKYVGDLADQFERKRLMKFVRDTDFTKLDVSGYPPVYIESGRWRFVLFNMHCCTNLLSLVAYSLSRKQLPYIAVGKKWGGAKPC